ncbi:MAG: hypothetical protein ACPHBM_07240, partial [Flavobacteriales bacterium]
MMRAVHTRLLVLGIAMLACAPGMRSQCLHSMVDTFDEEATVDPWALDPDGCAQLTGDLLSPNWHNVAIGDEADWIPNQG